MSTELPHDASRKIFKYRLPVDDVVTIELPRDAQILCVQSQHRAICLWAIVNPRETNTREHTFYVVGTGHPMPVNPGEYVGTVQLMEGNLVLHVFHVKMP